ncbi:S-layer homology domain-containing protein [Gorillibacterium timonense]|uniref:S-layer homology domain-containing protein n=1 Tax=Gorillibacterium timonense TaxID=1689269 RepID=UPI00071C795B|nr:S-layer homology domain-containing protein [Gorillibacterium timonense]
MKKLLLTCIAFILISAVWVTPALAGFKDVDGNRQYNWAKPSIDEMSRRGILNGFPDGTFRPGQPVTKAQFTVMVYRLFPLLRNPEPATIPGVPKNHWASKEFAELYSTTWPIYAADVQDFWNESYTYKPEKNMTRWEVLMTLDALFSKIEGPLEPEDSALAKELAKVKDIPQREFLSYESFEKSGLPLSLMSPKLALIREKGEVWWASDLDYVKASALYRFSKLGIITPDAKGYFYPDRSVTRAEIVTILNRMLMAAGEDYAYVKPTEPEEPMSYQTLDAGGETGFGANLFNGGPDTNIVLAPAPEWSTNPGQVVTKAAIRIEARQVMDIYITINGQTVKYTYEQFANNAQVEFDVTGVKSFHVRGEARYPERMTEETDNEVMIYVKDANAPWFEWDE